MADLVELKEIEERVILVAVSTEEESLAAASLEELEELVETAGAVTVDKIIQNRERIHPGTYLGKGKIEEVKERVWELNATGIVCDDELSPAQLRNLEDALDTKVMDRTMVILDIFASRATTREGKIQVELAQLKYRAARLVGLRNSLSRLGGGIGTRGPGEKKLEVDRRLIHDRIGQLKAELEDVKRHRDVARQQRTRNHTPVAAIVGYTNAGKSTLLNQLTGAAIPANNRLFDTLDTTSRLLTVSDTLDVVISDTVGFIRKLPHQLVEAFKATLEELEYADLLLHVIDVSNPDWQQQAQVVEHLIHELGADQLPRIDVFNKSDLVGVGEIMPHGENIVSISARTGEGVDKLLELIAKRLDKGSRRVVLHLPYDKGGLLDALYREAKVESVEYKDTIEVTAVCTPRLLGQLEPYLQR